MDLLEQAIDSTKLDYLFQVDFRLELGHSYFDAGVVPRQLSESITTASKFEETTAKVFQEQVPNILEVALIEVFALVNPVFELLTPLFATHIFLVIT